MPCVYTCCSLRPGLAVGGSCCWMLDADGSDAAAGEELKLSELSLRSLTIPGDGQPTDRCLELSCMVAAISLASIDHAVPV